MSWFKSNHCRGNPLLPFRNIPEFRPGASLAAASDSPSIDLRGRLSFRLHMDRCKKWPHVFPFAKKNSLLTEPDRTRRPGEFPCAEHSNQLPAEQETVHGNKPLATCDFDAETGSVIPATRKRGGSSASGVIVDTVFLSVGSDNTSVTTTRQRIETPARWRPFLLPN
jgi:hypothetical protein